MKTGTIFILFMLISISMQAESNPKSEQKSDTERERQGMTLIFQPTIHSNDRLIMTADQAAQHKSTLATNNDIDQQHDEQNECTWYDIANLYAACVCPPVGAVIYYMRKQSRK